MCADSRNELGRELVAASGDRSSELRQFATTIDPAKAPVTSGVSHPGRPFRAEAETRLYPDALRAANDLAARYSDLIVIQEPFSPLGVPDFVAVLGGDEWLRTRRESGIPPILSSRDCTVLSAIHTSAPLRVETVSQRLSWDISNVERSLRSLSEVGAVTFSRTGAVTRTNALTPQGALFAIEAKLKAWQRAVRQGRQYRTWADNYVIVLGDVGDVARKRASAMIAEDLAGLYFRGSWLARPRARRSQPAQRILGYEHIYAALA